MFRISKTVSMFAVASLSLGLIACGEDPPPETPQPPPPTPPPAPTPVVEPDPVPDTPASQGPCDAAQTLALKQAITGREKAELSGLMKPEQVFRCEHVLEGGTIEIPVTVQPNKCYSALAGSFPNITEVDLKVVLNFDGELPAGLNAFKNTVFAEDAETGPTAAIGRSPSCIKNLTPLMLPVPVKVIATAREGAGPMAIQVYSK